MGVSVEKCRRAYPVPEHIDSKIAVDIGANIGGFTAAYNKTFDKIYYFEANPTTFEIAKSNLKQFDNVIGYNLAVSDESGKTLVLMEHQSKDDGSVTCSPSVTHGKHSEWKTDIGEIKTISLENILKLIGDNNRINFLKIDCENSEYEFLLNKDLSKIDYIAMEVHWQMGKTKFDELIEYLKSFFDITKGRTTFMEGCNTEIFLTRRKM